MWRARDTGDGLMVITIGGIAPAVVNCVWAAPWNAMNPHDDAVEPHGDPFIPHGHPVIPHGDVAGPSSAAAGPSSAEVTPPGYAVAPPGNAAGPPSAAAGPSSAEVTPPGYAVAPPGNAAGPPKTIEPYDVVAVGETMAALVTQPPGPLNAGARMLLDAGGAESNVAICLAQAGRHVGWVSRLGADSLGRMIKDRVGGAGVDVSLVATDPDAPTGLYLREPGRVWYYRAGSAASRLTSDHLGRPTPCGVPASSI